ncbi:NAD(P)H-binding protein [Pelagibius litoralis]|uniref:NAD(P)H-binding protein n=1 Tax=Pelagibius litoralis TaxID=374515 RepID=A0A967KFH8_9PROT|nr:NAD(P)H-binding protein [Pelagibius litoralis]
MNGTTPVAGCVALTGATGFVGGHILRQLVDAGWRVKALTRRSDGLADFGPAVTPVVGSLESTAALTELVTDVDAAGTYKAMARRSRVTKLGAADPSDKVNLGQAVALAQGTDQKTDFAGEGDGGHRRSGQYERVWGPGTQPADALLRIGQALQIDQGSLQPFAVLVHVDPRVAAPRDDDPKGELGVNARDGMGQHGNGIAHRIGVTLEEVGVLQIGVDIAGRYGAAPGEGHGVPARVAGRECGCGNEAVTTENSHQGIVTHSVIPA